MAEQLTIEPRPDVSITHYAELWAEEKFLVSVPWVPVNLVAEDKGDERGIGARFKIDVFRLGYIGWRGRRGLEGTPFLVLSATADPGFLEVQPGVNILVFSPVPEEPSEPEEPGTPDTPDTPETLWLPTSVTFVGRPQNTRPVVITIWEKEKLVYQLPMDIYSQFLQESGFFLLAKEIRKIIDDGETVIVDRRTGASAHTP